MQATVIIFHEYVDYRHEGSPAQRVALKLKLWGDEGDDDGRLLILTTTTYDLNWNRTYKDVVYRNSKEALINTVNAWNALVMTAQEGDTLSGAVPEDEFPF